MNEKAIQKASNLIETREKLKKSLNEGFIKSVETTTDWYVGSGLQTMRRPLHEARLECIAICETLMRKRAENCIEEINRQLEGLGVSFKENDFNDRIILPQEE